MTKITTNRYELFFLQKNVCSGWFQNLKKNIIDTQDYFVKMDLKFS